MLSSSSPFVKPYTCPGCNVAFPTLSKLDFHLTYACISRTTSSKETDKSGTESGEGAYGKELVKTIPDDQRGQEIIVLDDDNPSGVSEDPKSTSCSLSGKKRQKPELVECPGCCRRLLAADLEFHLDHACLSRTPRLRIELGEFERKPPGLVLLENFITEEEEKNLVSLVEELGEWKHSKRNGKCDTKHWGVVIDYSAAKIRTRHPDPMQGEKDVPEFFNFILERFAKYPPLAAWWPNEANANRYIKSQGHFLTPHFDDRQLSGEIICNLSLLADCIMTFAKPDSMATPFRVRLPRLCASVMSRSARYDFTHAIHHEDLLGEKRISLNFRQQVAPLTNKPLQQKQ